MGQGGGHMGSEDPQNTGVLRWLLGRPLMCDEQKVARLFLLA